MTKVTSVIFKDPLLFLRPIKWTIAIFLTIGLLFSQLAPLEEWQRWALRVLFVLFGSYWFIITQYMMPRYWPRAWVIYTNTIVASAAIAVTDYLVRQIDLSPFYIILILVTAMMWDRRSALFAAALASVLSVFVELSSPTLPSSQLPHLLLLSLIYFVSALLVSELTVTLTKRWQTAAAEAEQQRREIAHRRDELEGLHVISQTFGHLEDVDATFRQVTERIAQLLNAEICAIATVSPDGNQLQGMSPGYGISYEQIRNFRMPVFSEDLASPRGIANAESFFVNDLAELESPLREFVESQNVRQLVSSRMLLHGRLIGMIFVANRTDGSPFNDEDAHLLSILAGQAAIAVENARFYQQAQANLRDMARLYAVSAQLAIRSGSDEIPQRVVQAIAEALNAPVATIALLNESTGLLEYSASLGVPVAALNTPFRAEGVAMKVVRTGEPRFLENIQTADDVNPVIRTAGYRAMACLPIRLDAKSLGVLYVNYLEPHTFTPTEKNMLAIFANQIAIALENAKLLRAEQRRALELTVLSNLSRSLAETMDLTEMFRVVEREVRPNMPAADAGALLLFDPQSELLIPRASFGFDRAIIQRMALRPGESIAGKVFQDNQALLFRGRAAIRDARRTLRPDNQALLAAATPWSMLPQSVVAAPVRASGETFGVVVLDNSKSPDAFTPDDLELLVAMADRIALAIRNAHLFAREQRRASQLAIVNDLGHHVTSILDMDELERTLVSRIREKFGYRHVHLFVNDQGRLGEPAREETVLRAGAGAPATELVPGQFTLRFEQGIVGWTAAHGKTLIANDVSKEPRFVFHPALAETRAEIAVPLSMGARILGVLDIQSERLNAFEPSDITTLETLAGQVAIAIENARLYGETQEQARRDSLTQVYNHGYFLVRLDEEIERAQREAKPLSLIMLDVDYFKEYNDTYGHVIGDQVLTKIVQAIRAHVKHSDLVGRWGGEEFCVALLGNDTPSALCVAERIRQTLVATRIETKDGKPILPPTISQGIASFPVHTQDTATLIDLADIALYRAKSAGRDQVSFAGAEVIETKLAQD